MISVSYSAAQGDKASSLAKKILKMGQGKNELYPVNLNAEPFLSRADDILHPRPPSSTHVPPHLGTLRKYIAFI